MVSNVRPHWVAVYTDHFYPLWLWKRIWDYTTCTKTSTSALKHRQYGGTVGTMDLWTEWDFRWMKTAGNVQNWWILVTLPFQSWNKNGDEVSLAIIECSNHFAHTQQFSSNGNLTLLVNDIYKTQEYITVFPAYSDTRKLGDFSESNIQRNLGEAIKAL